MRPLWRSLGPSSGEVSLPASVGGIALRNPVGLAAGLDKHCASLDSLAALGFGYVVGGTVTAQARPGNPRPRVLRLTERESVINALGFPGDGLDAALARLERLRRMPARVLVSIAALDEQETAECAARLQPLVDGVEVNISSPNTAGLRRFQEPEALRGLLGVLDVVRLKPLFVKVPPWTNDEEREEVLALVRVCREAGVDAGDGGEHGPRGGHATRHRTRWAERACDTGEHASDAAGHTRRVGKRRGAERLRGHRLGGRRARCPAGGRRHRSALHRARVPRAGAGRGDLQRTARPAAGGVAMTQEDRVRAAEDVLAATGPLRNLSDEVRSYPLRLLRLVVEQYAARDAPVSDHLLRLPPYLGETTLRGLLEGGFVERVTAAYAVYAYAPTPEGLALLASLEGDSTERKAPKRRRRG